MVTDFMSIVIEFNHIVWLFSCSRHLRDVWVIIKVVLRISRAVSK